MDNKLTKNQKLENIIKAGLELIPSIGSSLSTLYFGRKQQKEFNRLTNFYNDLSLELNNLGEKLSIENQDQEILAILIEKINSKVEREVVKEKIEYFKNYFKNILIHPVKKNDYDEKVSFLEILSSMTLLEIKVLKFLNLQNGLVLVGSIKIDTIEQYAIVGSINHLRNLGFLQSSTGSMSIGGESDNYLKELVKMSSFGMKFINFCLSFS